MQRTVVDNRYRILEPLGSGGMAEVCLAHDDVLDRDVALKLMNRGDDEEFVERFKREARSAASLSHPNIVPIYDQGTTEDGEYYISMEYLRGGTLRERIEKNGTLAPQTAIEVAMEVCEALEEAHERGIVHRDIKPRNILVTGRGDVKVADFGIAYLVSSGTLSQSGTVLGTASYMAPEQALGECATPKSDLYALGVVLYEMLAGEPPFIADNPVSVSIKHVNEPPPALPDAPEEVNALVMMLLAKDPEDRHADAAELMEDLQRVRDGLPPVGGSVGEERSVIRRVSDRPEPAEAPPEMVVGAPEHSPGLAAVLSLVLSGVGQIYNGQILKGITVIAIQLINFALTAILIGWVPLVLVWVWAVWDAHRVARRIVAEGYGARRRLWPWVVTTGSVALAVWYVGWDWLQGLLF